MNFRLIALASCVALGSIAFGGKAQAQSFTPFDVILTADGTLGTTCTLGTTAAGIMLPVVAVGRRLSSDGVGTPASFELTCTNSANVILRGPTTATSPTTVAGTSSVTAILKQTAAVVASSSTGTDSASVALAAPTGFINRVYTVSNVITGTALAPLDNGPYTVETIVQVTPN